MDKLLAGLGFSPSEIKIYLHLLREGSSYVNKISYETKINRTNVYEAIGRLISKGVISFITKNNVKWLEAKSPDHLKFLIKEKEEEFQKEKKQIFNYLARISKEKKSPLEANIFVGKKGLRALYEEILKTKKPISLIASELQFKEFFGPYYELWHKRRAELKIKQRTILPKTLEKIDKQGLNEYKFIDNKFTSPTTTAIYGDNCLFIQWSKEPIAIKIQNKEIAKTHLNYFNMVWNS